MARDDVYYGNDIKVGKENWEYRVVHWSCKISEVSVELISKVILVKRFEGDEEGDSDIWAKFVPGRENSSKMSLRSIPGRFKCDIQHWK